MQPIITLPEHKVDTVIMSPCERYVLTYAPMSKNPYVIWNFQLVELIRDFDQKEGETATSYQWSHDGEYIAKKSVQEITKQNADGTEEVVKSKPVISVYTLPSMELLATSDGKKKSITVEGLTEFLWAPNLN